MKRDAMEAVSIPLLITGVALLAAAGFFTAMRQWIEARVHGIEGSGVSNAPPSTPGAQGQSGLDGQGQSGGGGGGGGGGVF